MNKHKLSLFAAVLSILILLAPATALATGRIWTGGGDGSSWGQASNWDFGVPSDGWAVAINGDAFTNSSSPELNNDLSDFQASDLIFTGSPESVSLAISGNDLHIISTITDNSTGLAFDKDIDLNIIADSDLSVTNNDGGVMTFYDSLSLGSHNLTFNPNGNSNIIFASDLLGDGSGCVTFAGNSVEGTTLNANGDVEHPIQDPATVTGNLYSFGASFNKLTVNHGGLLQLATDLCNTSKRFKSRGTLYAVLGGTSACSGYGQLRVHGAVDIRDSKLVIGWTSRPKINHQYVIVKNDGSDSIKGTFKFHKEGRTFSVTGLKFKLNYHGGTGHNDIVLTRIK